MVWIEIVAVLKALYAETGRHPRGWCGLKSIIAIANFNKAVSPPARVVWIEIVLQVMKKNMQTLVATREGGVD